MNYYAGLDVSLEETAICVVDALMCALIDPPEPWAQLSEWLQFRAELDLPLAAGGDCSDGFCRELVQDCKRVGGRC